MFDWNLEKDDVSVTHPQKLKLISVVEPCNIRPLVLQSDYEALQAENAEQTRQLDYEILKRAEYELECAVQAKRIAALEASRKGNLSLRSKIRALSKPITDKQIKQAAKNIHMTNAVSTFELRQFVDALMDEIQN